MKAILRKNATLLLPVEFAAYERILVGYDDGHIVLKAVSQDTIYAKVGSKLTYCNKLARRPQVWLKGFLRELGLDKADLAKVSGEYSLMEIEKGKYIFLLTGTGELEA